MSTDNPRIAAYIPQALYDRLQQFKKEQGFKSESQAVTLVLSEFFGVGQGVAHQSGSDLAERMEAVENRLTLIKSELLNELKSELLSTKPRSEPQSELEGEPQSGSYSVSSEAERRRQTTSELPKTELKRGTLTLEPKKPQVMVPHSESSSSSLRQPKDLSELLRTEWGVYLQHPRGTVERIAGPFLSEREARQKMSSQISFGLFPESKGYRWECREEAKGSELEDPDDEPDEILTDFLVPEPPTLPQYSLTPKGEGWLTTGEAFEQLKTRGFQKSIKTFRRLLEQARAVEKLPLELEQLGLVADFEKRKQFNPKDSNVRWLRFK